MKIKSPCYNGRDCPKRKVGCRKTCPEWAEYEEAVEQDRERRHKHFFANNDVQDYMMKESIKRHKRSGKY
jgi:hypothetical protein